MASLTVMKKKPSPSAIECLTDLLEKAKSGDLQFLIYLVVVEDGTETGNAGRHHDRHTLIGYIESMKLDYYSRRREADKEEIEA